MGTCKNNLSTVDYQIVYNDYIGMIVSEFCFTRMRHETHAEASSRPVAGTSTRDAPSQGGSSVRMRLVHISFALTPCLLQRD